MKPTVPWTKLNCHPCHAVCFKDLFIIMKSEIMNEWTVFRFFLSFPFYCYPVFYPGWWTEQRDTNSGRWLKQNLHRLQTVKNAAITRNVWLIHLRYIQIANSWYTEVKEKAHQMSQTDYFEWHLSFFLLQTSTVRCWWWARWSLEVGMWAASHWNGQWKHCCHRAANSPWSCRKFPENKPIFPCSDEQIWKSPRSKCKLCPYYVCKM